MGPLSPMRNPLRVRCRSLTVGRIRRAYKRKALELHPDRNFNDVENATKKFAEVQTAYEILSDPQERAWYDSHRDAILGGEDDFGPGLPTSRRVVTHRQGRYSTSWVDSARQYPWTIALAVSSGV